MKNLTIFVHTGDQYDLTNRLHAIKQVGGFTLSQIEGHGSLPEQDPFLVARDKVIGSIPRVRADIVLQDNDVEPVLTALRLWSKEHDAQGAYFYITPVEREGRLV